MLKINKDSRIPAFDKFKSVVKGTLGLQMFKSTEYFIRQAAGSNDCFTVRFKPALNLVPSQLHKAWELIYKDCLEYGLGDPTYVKDYIPEPCIYNNTLIFRIDYK